MNRIDTLKHTATDQGKTANLLIFCQPNLTYYTNFSGATALLIPQQGEAILYVSGVNYEQAKAEAKDATVELVKRGENLMEKIAKQAPKAKFAVDSLGIEGWRILAKAVGGEGNLDAAGDLIREQRRKKDPGEIALIREACRIADVGMHKAMETIDVGVKEKRVSAEAEYAMRRAGSDGTAFDTIVACGFCCAYPHGTFQENTIQDGDFVVVDLGATHRFYRSDITRTFAAGDISEKQEKIYKAVWKAQQTAIEAIKPGVAAREVDAAARRVIKAAGFGEFFVHNLGHGIGLEVHEAPILSPDSKDMLEAGNVVTVEPGIYLPGFGGTRVEDTVLVTEYGAEKLTHSPAELVKT